MTIFLRTQGGHDIAEADFNAEATEISTTVDPVGFGIHLIGLYESERDLLEKPKTESFLYDIGELDCLDEQYQNYKDTSHTTRSYAELIFRELADRHDLCVSVD